MRQAVHLLIVDLDRGTALAAHFGTRWLLPVITCGERVRADRSALRWASARGYDGDVAGQWLGRVGQDTTDWLVVVTATAPGRDADPQLSWTPLDALFPHAALLEYQGWAVARSLERGALPQVAGPFGCPSWIVAVKSWIEQKAGAPCGCFVPYRTGAHEVVLGAHSPSGPVFFKGLSSDRAGEARLTRLLSHVEPVRFARTLALDERDGGAVWWLTAGCPGRPPVDGQRVARALAQVQHQVMSSEMVLNQLPVLDLPDVFAWTADLLDDAAARDALYRCLEAVVLPHVPRSWTPMDLDPVNVLVDGSDVRFIDLDDSFAGPAPLAMALFAGRSGDRSSCRVYQQSWLPPLSGIRWPAFERAVAVLDAWLGWHRIARNTRRGNLHGALAVAERRIRSRLLRALHRR